MTQTVEEIYEEAASLNTPQEREALIKVILETEKALQQSRGESATAAMMREQYKLLDQMTAFIAQKMGYPLNIKEWKDKIPLEMMLRLFPKIEETYWYKVKYGAYLHSMSSRVTFL